MKKRKSIHDIARELHLSASTISYVLNGKAGEKRITQESIKKVEDYIKQIGYQPNQLARSLRTGRSQIIAVLVEDISDAFFSSITRVIEEEAYQLGYKIFNASTDNDPVKTRSLIATFRDMQVDGFLIAPPPDTEEEIRMLLNDDLPVVLFDRYFPSLATHNIIIDNFNGTYMAIAHFIANGYKNIGFITLDSSQLQMEDRLLGYSRALEAHHLPGCIEKFSYKVSHGEVVEQMRAFLQIHQELDAVLFATNYLAMGGLKAIDELGLRIPEDLAVIGFDDNLHYSMFRPYITAVAQPIKEISHRAVQQLIACIGEKDKPAEGAPQTVILPADLMIRDSAQPRTGIYTSTKISN